MQYFCYFTINTINTINTENLSVTMNSTNLKTTIPVPNLSGTMLNQNEDEVRAYEVEVLEDLFAIIKEQNQMHLVQMDTLMQTHAALTDALRQTHDAEIHRMEAYLEARKPKNCYCVSITSLFLLSTYAYFLN